MNALADSFSPRNFALGIAPYRYADLFDPEALAQLDALYVDNLEALDPKLAASFRAWRAGATLPAAEESELLIAAAAPLGVMVARLFGAQAMDKATHLADAVRREHAIDAFKTQFVDKRVRRKAHDAALAPLDEATRAQLEHAFAPDCADDPELGAARAALGLLALWQVVDSRPAAPEQAIAAAGARLSEVLGRAVPQDALKPTLLQLLQSLAAWHRERIACVDWVSYRSPTPIHPDHLTLVHTERPNEALPQMLEGAHTSRRARTGFDLTDSRMDLRHAQAEVAYCLLCHPRGKDSCRHGLTDKAGDTRVTPLGTPLGGCPLDERISEAHVLAGRGEILAALSVIMVDNPMVPGTGHRICNDCMKACVFQKQAPVDIPQVETHILSEVLALPYGFEMYGLLTRFNPLRRARPTPLPYHGHKALVVGLGPAGYTLSHYLLQEGFGVVAIDGLKLEPLPENLIGADTWPPESVEDYTSISEGLGDRAPQGFGGVAEYGITVRWDKNFLKVIHLTLARAQHFTAFGGIRFGGTLTLDDAWAQGFDHVALAAGAGKPTVVPLKNNLMRGMRTASDFLMGLQLGGAFRPGSLTSLQVELPAVVIGGGLTAVDTATELAAYYPVQVQKIAAWVARVGHSTAMAALDNEERQILQRFLAHAEELEIERAKACPDVPGLVRRWGGVSVAYRRALTDSPAYRLNHEEVHKALEEGVRFIEQVTPVAGEPDAYGHVEGLSVRTADGTLQVLPARAVIMAAGTSPNTTYERELPGTFALDGRGRFFAAHKLADAGSTSPLQPAQAMATDAIFTSYVGAPGATGVPRLVSFYGDNHPRYAGNVVRAMASAKYGHPHVVRLFADAIDRAQARAARGEQMGSWGNFVATLAGHWQARVQAVHRLTPTIVEVVVHAPMQARKFAPGQFFRLQNFERDAMWVGDQALSMEGLALTGAWVDPEAGLLGMVALEMGVSSRLVAHLKPGQEVALMGPTGTATHIPRGETVMLCGGGLGNAVLFSVARALREAGNRVLYFAGYRNAGDIYKRDEVESSSDQVIWSVDSGEPPVPRRPQDRSTTGNIVAAMHSYARGELGADGPPLQEVDRIIAIGSDRMMAAVARARQTTLAHVLKKSHVAVASINSPMQCMLKEVCAQCLQRHIDPVTGEETYVFSCFNQDQPQDTMDWSHLSARLRQNTVMEKISGLLVERLWKDSPVEDNCLPAPV